MHSSHAQGGRVDSEVHVTGRRKRGVALVEAAAAELRPTACRWAKLQRAQKHGMRQADLHSDDIKLGG